MATFCSGRRRLSPESEGPNEPKKGFMIFPTLLLTTGLIDDLLNRKVHNIVSMVLLALALGHSLAGGNLWVGFLGLGAAFVLLFPLFALRVVGAGDVKLMMAFGMATSKEAVASVIFYGMIWAALFGVTKLLVAGEQRNLLQLPKMVLSGFHQKFTSVTQLPMTFPLVLGWLSHLHLTGGAA